MAVAVKQEMIYSLEEYLAQEEQAEMRSEFYRGEIFAMTGGSANHNRITLTLASALNNGLADLPCEVFMSDVRLLVKREELYTYPDIMVICGSVEYAPKRTDTVTNPVAIIEVLSPSTESYDRGKKFEFYRALETFREYVLIDQQRVYVEHYRMRDDRQWVLSILDDPDDELVMRTFNFTVPLDSLYQRVVWENEVPEQ